MQVCARECVCMCIVMQLCKHIQCIPCMQSKIFNEHWFRILRLCIQLASQNIEYQQQMQRTRNAIYFIKILFWRYDLFSWFYNLATSTHERAAEWCGDATTKTKICACQCQITAATITRITYGVGESVRRKL